MTHLDSQWAWSQVEAFADGTLPRADRERMHAAMAGDARLREAVELAGKVRGELRRLGRGPVPASQWRRLLHIPSAAPRAGSRRVLVFSAAGLAAAALAAVALTALLEPSRTPPPVSADEQARAVADFAVAMTYLNRSTAIAGKEVSTAVRGGLRDALTVGRDALRNKPQTPSNGD